MKKASLAHVKAHLSELVDEAEHHRRRIVILRHGKPAAALVPVDVALPPRVRQKMTAAASEKSLRAFIDEFSALDRDQSAVEDLLRGRR